MLVCEPGSAEIDVVAEEVLPSRRNSSHEERDRYFFVFSALVDPPVSSSYYDLCQHGRYVLVFKHFSRFNPC